MWTLSSPPLSPPKPLPPLLDTAVPNTFPRGEGGRALARSEEECGQSSYPLRIASGFFKTYQKRIPPPPFGHPLPGRGHKWRVISTKRSARRNPLFPMELRIATGINALAMTKKNRETLHKPIHVYTSQGGCTSPRREYYSSGGNRKTHKKRKE